MKKALGSIKVLVMIAVLFQATMPSEGDCCKSTVKTCNFSKNLWQPRSFPSYNLREIYMLKDLYDHPFKHDEWDGTFSYAFEFMQSFDTSTPSQNLGAMPFWSGTNSMTIGNNNGQSDVDAYQFGMGETLSPGVITLSPKAQHFGSDFIMHFTRYKHDKGFFFKIRTSLGAMTTDSQLCEEPATLENNIDEAWVMYPALGGRYQSLSEAFTGGTPGDMFVSGTSLNKALTLNYGKISCCKLSSTRLGDLSTTLGFNAFADEHYFFSLGFKATFPTGTIPTGEFIFEPIFGRAGHWGTGLEATGHYKHWISENEGSAVDVWTQVELMHLSSGRKPSWRSFDLKLNGAGSKYLLLQFYFPANPSDTNSTGRVPSFITQAINVTTMPVISSFTLEGSLGVIVEYSKRNWNMSLGVDVWGRTAECLQIDTCNAVHHGSANLNDFAVLGRQISEDSRFTNQSPTPFEPLYLCEPLAQIGKSENRVLAQGTPPSGPSSQPDSSSYNTNKIKDARIAENRIPEGLYDALDIAGAAEGRSLNARLSLSGGYAWVKTKHSPSINVFAGLEFASYDSLRLNMWSLGFNGSLNF